MNTKLNELIDNNTPAYVFDADVLIDRTKWLKQRLGSAILCYAIKANPFLIKSLDEEIEKYEVCSQGELFICISQGISMDKIVLSGVNKEKSDVEYAMSKGVSHFTIESLLHLDIIQSCAKKQNICVNAIIRLSSGNQFGCDKELIQKILLNKNKYDSVQIDGIQYYSGTQKKGSKIKEEVQELVQYISELNSEYNASLKTLEYGPGLLIEYYRKNASEEETLADLIEALKETKSELNIVLEMGRFLSATCGSYITKVVDVKQTYDKTYCIVDGGINHVNYYGQVMGARIPPVKYIKAVKKDELIQNEFERGNVSICGSLCTTADVLIRDVHIDNVEVGDYFIFDKIGAYSVTEGIYLFLSRKLPKVYIKRGENLELVRADMETYSINCPQN